MQQIRNYDVVNPENGSFIWLISFRKPPNFIPHQAVINIVFERRWGSIERSFNFHDFLYERLLKNIFWRTIEKMNFTLTVAEDLDCSGLPVSDETICTYDEGFLSGLLSEYTGGHFDVKEVDCWCSGDRVCRFAPVRRFL